MRIKIKAHYKKLQKQFRKARKNAWSVQPRKWIAVCTLGAYSLGVYDYAMAQQPSPARQQPSQTAGALPTRRFDIPAGLLGPALDAFHDATGLQVVVAMHSMRSLNSPGVSGVFTQEEALKRMLTGTGVTYRFTNANTIRFELAGVRQSVEVADQVGSLAEPVMSSPKYTEPMLDTPQTIMVIPKAIIEEQGATTLRDVLRNVPGLTVAAGEGGVPAGDNLTIRGFSARNDLFVDGVRDLGVQSRDPFNMEQVEVTKGPTSAFTGRGSTGGAINMVSKSAFLRRSVGMAVNLGTDKTKRFTGDINLPLRRLGLGERTALRLNGLYHDAGVAGRNAVYSNRWGLAPTLTFGTGSPTRLTLGYYKLKQDNLSDYGIPWVPVTNNALFDYRDRPAPVPRETFYGYNSRDKENTNADQATIKFEHDFDDSLNFRNQFRYGHSSRDSMATPPRFASNDSTVINREMRSWIAEDSIVDNQTDLRARFNTGSVGHAVVVGAAFTHETNVRQNRTAPNAPTTLLNPNPDDLYTGVITTSPFVGRIAGTTQALYAFDTLHFGRHLEAVGGMRWERFDVAGVTTAPATVSRVDRMPSVRAGLVYKPVQRGSIYASYGTSFNPSLEGLSYATANTAIEPEKTYISEFGGKVELGQNRMLLSGAVFRVDKTNARTPGILPDDPPQVLEGRQRSDGFELSATGNITHTWKLFAAYTFINAKIVESNTPAEVGKYFQNTPRNSYSVWTTYQIKKLSIGGGPRFLDKRYGNNTNTREVPSYWTLDALASYAISQNLDLRVNLYNLNNAYYFDRLGGGHLIPGAARSVNVTMAVRF